MISTGQFKQRLIDSATMFVVSGVSLLLLMYIAFGEAQRTHQQYYVEKLAAQAKVIQISLENYLRPGLPLTQYAGFTTKAEPIVASDDSITALSVFTSNGDALFSAGDLSIPLLFTPLDLDRDTQPDYQVDSSETYIQVVLPLRNRFETVGHLAITMERVAVTDRVEDIFGPLLYVALGLSVAFAVFVAIGSPRFAHARFPWLQVGFSCTFITMAVFVVGTLIVLYSEGTQAKARALADSLGQRLSDLVSFGLNLDEIYGLDDIFNNYLRLNPDISAAGIAVDGAVKIIDQDQVVDEWVPGGSTYHYIVDLTPPGGEREISVFVALPEAVVYREIIRSVKNFAALFIASAFLAGVFLQLARSMQRLRLRFEQGASPDPHGDTGEAALSLVKPVFFLAVLVEHLTYSFLPQYINGIVEEAQLSPSIVSAPFMLYYLFFALSLIPAGHFAQRSSPKPLMYVGLLLSAVGLVMLALPGDIALVILARAISGIGQGMLFIGVQSYILTMASPDRKTQGAAIIVFGFQGGMISGMAVGSLLVTFIGPEAVFVVAGAIAAAVAVYALMIVPTPKRVETVTQTIGENVRQILSTMMQVTRDIQFLKTMFLIGIPAKAILTGIIIFALPLLLSERGYPQEDIGQIIMVYAAGVIIASGLVSRVADRLGNTHMILFWGAIISGVGLVAVGCIGLDVVAESRDANLIEAALLIGGVAIVGIAHGFINAPVVTHVADSSLSQSVGSSSLTATYRFLERIGHVAGPIIIGQLFVFAGADAEVLAWVGGAVAILGVLFLIGAEPGRAFAARMMNTPKRETV